LTAQDLQVVGSILILLPQADSFSSDVPPAALSLLPLAPPLYERHCAYLI
jgi:hypothetical protein